MRSQYLSKAEATMLVAGAGIGTGIFTLPAAISKVGIWGMLIAVTPAFIISLLLYYMIADLALLSHARGQLLAILKEHLFRGRFEKPLTLVFFILLVAILLENLVIYILCAAGIMESAFAVPVWLSKMLFYVIASVVVIFGIQAIGKGEKVGMLATGIVIVLLSVLALFGPLHPPLPFGEDPSVILAVYGLFMFAFSAIFAIVQVCTYLEDQRQVKAVVRNGLLINMGATLLFAMVAMIASESVTEIAVVGIWNSLQSPAVKILCAILVLISMFTSYWSIGLAFADVVAEFTKKSQKTAWFLCTIPTFLLVLFLPVSILKYIQMASGALSLMLGIMVVPAYARAVKGRQGSPLLGTSGTGKGALVIAGAGILAMAVSAFIPV